MQPSPHDGQADLVLDGKSLSFSRLRQHLADPAAHVSIAKDAMRRVAESSRFFDDVQASGVTCYGINTGFGDLARFHIAHAHQAALQRRLVLSHAIGAKRTLGPDIGRLVLLLRLNALARGASGVRPELVRHLEALYNGQAYPELYEAGSLGASGDLGPLAHLAAFAIGHGQGYLCGKRLRARAILKRIGLTPIGLVRKEGLSLINGTAAMVAVGFSAMLDALELFEISLIGLALLIDAASLQTDFLEEAAFDLKPHPGARIVAGYLEQLLATEGESMPTQPQLLQLPYSFRCAPFVLGTALDSMSSCIRTLEIEANSANDNPLYLGASFPPYHGGHFHGHVVSVALDQFRVAMVHLSGLIDRQLDFILDEKRGSGLPPFLSAAPQLGHPGLEGAQYLVTSLHVDNVGLAQPVSCRTLPTNGGNQDYVSLGLHSAIATRRMIENIRLILPVYLLAATQAYELRRAPARPNLQPVNVYLSRLLRPPYDDEALLKDRLDLVAQPAVLRDCLLLAKRASPSLPKLIT